MQCKILAVGGIKERYFTDGINEYLKRLKPVFPVSIKEVPDLPVPQNASPAEVAQIVAKEGEALLAQIPQDAYLVALAINGKMLSSEQLAAKLNDWAFSGKRELIFVIGGSCGLSPDVLARADFKLSFGAATYPHQLMRLILCEQIYRGVKINRHEPYHK